MPTVQEKLKAGQVPLRELPRVEKAHDVRTLRPCTGCEGIGNADSMIEHGASFYHGRCFIQHCGEAAFLALPKAQTDKVTIGDIGWELMKKLVDRGSRK